MKNKIICGDFFQLVKRLPDKSVDCVFTSPPYNRKRNDKYLHYTDIIDDYKGFLESTISELKRVVKKHIFLNIQANYYNSKDIYSLIGDHADEIRQIIIWEKTNPLPAPGKSITNAFEYFVVIGEEPLKSNSTYTKNIISTSVNTNIFPEHKAVMKQEVADWFIEKFTQPGDLIFDPFMGVGTTAIACIKYGRDYLGFEISPKYCGMAEQRIIKKPKERILEALVI